MKAASKRICSARNRQGGLCQKPPLKGKQRCKLHGGATPKGRQTGPLKHGLYSSTLSEEERELWDEIKLGNVDDELRLCRIQLRRAMNLDAEISKAPNDPKNLAGIELVEIKRTTGNGKSSTDATSKRPDVAGRMNTLIGRIAQLEKTRSELLTAAAGKPGMDVRFVVEIPPEEQAGEWLATYGGTMLTSTPPAAPDPGDDEEPV
jgi:hypothetical protein